MTEFTDIVRPDPALCEALQKIGTATAAGELYNLGVTHPHMAGLTAWSKDKRIAGPALTLQCMPKRQDIVGDYPANGGLHHTVMHFTKPGDIIVVDARGDMEGGIFGDMMLTYFVAHGGAGVVVDGCLRDWPDIEEFGLDLGIWMRGLTPNHGYQNRLMFWGVNVPVSCGNVFVMPGDIIVADADGAICVPVKLAPEVVRLAGEKREWEAFSRQKLKAGEEMRKYYPLSAEGRVEYEAWRAAKGEGK